MFRQGFSCPALLIFHRTCAFAYRAITVYGRPFQDRSTNTCATFGLLPVRSSLLGESRLISFPSATEMFQFTEFPTLRSAGHPCSVARFGDLRINAC